MADYPVNTPAGSDRPDRPDGPLVAPTYTPTVEQAARIRLVTDAFKDAEQGRRGQDELWLRCVAFVAGKQWHRWNWTVGALELPSAPEHVIRPVHNLVRPKVAQAAAALVSDLPQLDVEPMSNQEQDYQEARAGKHLLQYLQQRLTWDRLWLSVGRWITMTGSAFVKVRWDPLLWDMHAVPQMDPATGQPAMTQPPTDPDTGQPVGPPEPVIAGKLRRIGQIATDLVAPFELYPQPDAGSFQAAEWVIHAKVRSLEYIRRAYPEFGKFVRSEGDGGAGGSSGGYLERRVADVLAANGSGRPGAKQNSAVVLEYWRKPCDDYPDGLLVTVSNGVLLRDQGLPYEHLVKREVLPFVEFGYEGFDVGLWAQGLVEHLLDPQREYNRAWSDFMGILKMTGMPKFLVHRGTNIPRSSITSKPGEVIIWMGDHKPEYWTPGPIPPQWGEILDRLKSDLEDIAYRHGVSAGAHVPGLTAGVSIQLEQEADNKSFGPIVAAFQQAIADVGMHALSLAREFYDEQRLGYVIGDDGGEQVRAFQRDELPDFANVKPVAASKVPMSRAAKQQQLFDLYDRGAFGPVGSPIAARTLLKRLEFGDVDGLYEEQVAFAQAQQQAAAQQQQAQLQQQAQNQAGLQQQQAAAQAQAQGATQQAQAAQQTQQQANAVVGQLAQAQQQHEHGLQAAEQQHGHAQELQAQEQRSQAQLAAAQHIAEALQQQRALALRDQPGGGGGR